MARTAERKYMLHTNMLNTKVTKLAYAAMLVSAVAFGAFSAVPAIAAAPMAKTSAPGFFRLMVGEFEVTALNDRHIEEVLSEDAAGDFRQCLSDQYRQQTGLDRCRCRQPFRPHFGEINGESTGLWI
jgi:hypothetical protein